MIRFLPPLLREPRRPAIAILAGWALAFFPSLFLSVATRWLLPGVARPEFTVDGPAMVLLLVIFSPLVETMIMAAVLELMLLVRVLPLVAVLLSSLGWGIAHSLLAPAWGLVIWWPFLIFSALYIVWRQRGIAAGVAIVFATHALQNLLPALLLLRSA